jgi:hypothetical protein
MQSDMKTAAVSGWADNKVEHVAVIKGNTTGNNLQEMSYSLL